jgi:hypothetical protein
MPARLVDLAAGRSPRKTRVKRRDARRPDRPHPDVFHLADMAYGRLRRLALPPGVTYRNDDGGEGIADPPLMFAEVGVPLLAGMFLDINASIIALMIVTFFLHEATALWDVSYAVTARDVTPIEQHVHSFLEMIPLMAMLSVISLHWGQFMALFGFGNESAQFMLRWKQTSLPGSYIFSILAALCFSNCSLTSKSSSEAFARENRASRIGLLYDALALLWQIHSSCL